MSNQKSSTLGLRERKKQQTRLAISDVATGLFIARGFDNVTIAEVAAAADVSVNTVFNYFSTKEELLFDRAAELIDAPSRIVRERRRGESAVAALRREFRRLLKGDTASLFGQRIAPFLRTVEASSALKARARLLLEECEDRLAKTLLEEAGPSADDAQPRAIAAMTLGVLALVSKALRDGVLRGVPDERLHAELLKLGERGFELLLKAAGDYGVRS